MDAQTKPHWDSTSHSLGGQRTISIPSPPAKFINTAVDARGSQMSIADTKKTTQFNPSRCPRVDTSSVGCDGEEIKGNIQRTRACLSLYYPSLSFYYVYLPTQALSRQLTSHPPTWYHNSALPASRIIRSAIHSSHSLSTCIDLRQLVASVLLT